MNYQLIMLPNPILVSDEKIKDIDDVKRIITRTDYNDPVKLTFVNRNGETNSFIFR